MRYIRGRSTEAVDYIQDHLLPDDDFPVGALVDSLKDMLLHTPDSVFLGLVFDGDEVVSFVIALAPPSASHVFIHQTWASESLPDTTVQDKLFLRLCMWTEAIDRSELRAETRRNAEPSLLRWGFHEYSRILSFVVSEDLTEKIINVSPAVVQKESANDSPVGSANSLNSRVESKPIVECSEHPASNNNIGATEANDKAGVGSSRV